MVTTEKLDKRICAYCGKLFLPRYPNQKYCCIDCEERMKLIKIKAKKKYICKNCGREFEYNGSKTFCSENCRRDYELLSKKTKKSVCVGSEIICEKCGKKFIKKYKNEKYCDDCKIGQDKNYMHNYYLKRKVKLPTRKCVICGKEFEPYKRTDYCCCDKCKKSYQKIKNIEYQKKHREKIKEKNNVSR